VTADLPHASQPHPGLGRREFVAFVAAVMMVNALGIDLMLPALPAIGERFGVAEANQLQWIVTSYMAGFGIGQLAYGPLADRYGRKPVLLVTLAGYVAASLFAGFAASFSALLAARALQGLMSASTRVLAVAIVRDSYSGRRMAATMSLAQMVFFLVPILAPSLGQLVLELGPWRLIFRVLAGFGLFVFVWSAWRLPETLPPERRRPLSSASLGPAYRLTLTNRYSLGYALASALTFGGIIAFVSSSQQIFADVFGERERFGLLFAICAAAMGSASFLNSRLVERLGTRIISQTGLVLLIVLAAAHIAVAEFGAETLWTFVAFQALSMTCVGLCGANFGAMAMEPVGHVAGTASSIQGFISSLGAVVVGSLIGQAFDGSTTPLAIGYLAIGVAAFGIVARVEQGRLFRPRAEA
jgi:MFS transporter, DHA1 family, multidrug resistance protein